MAQGIASVKGALACVLPSGQGPIAHTPDRNQYGEPLAESQLSGSAIVDSPNTPEHKRT
jgi:hypothetical protein